MEQETEVQAGNRTIQDLRAGLHLTRQEQGRTRRSQSPLPTFSATRPNERLLWRGLFSIPQQSPCSFFFFFNWSIICFTGFPCGSAGKESSCNVGDLSLIPGLGRSPGEGKSYPLQYSGLENSMDYIVHRVAKSQTRLSNFHFYSCFTMLC